MDNDKGRQQGPSRRVSRIPQLTQPKQAARRGEMLKRGDATRTRTTTRSSFLPRTKPSVKLGTTTLRPGRSTDTPPVQQCQYQPNEGGGVRRPLTKREAPAAQVAISLQRKTPVGKEASFVRQGVPAKHVQSAASRAAGSKQTVRPSSATGRPTSGRLASTSIASRRSASVPRSASTAPRQLGSAASRLGASVGEGLPKQGQSGRTGGTSKEGLAAKKPTLGRETAGTLLRPTVKEAGMASQGMDARQGGVGKMPYLRRTAVGKQEAPRTAGVALHQEKTLGKSELVLQSDSKSEGQQRSPKQGQNPEQQKQGPQGDKNTVEEVQSPKLRKSIGEPCPANPWMAIPRRIEFSDSQQSPRQQRTPSPREGPSPREQGSRTPREAVALFHSRLGRGADGEQCKAKLSKSSHPSHCHSADRSSSFSTEEFSEIEEQALATADSLVHNGAGPFAAALNPGSFSFGLTAGTALGNEAGQRHNSARGCPLSSQAATTKQPSGLLDLDKESSFASSELSTDPTSFTPASGLGEEELRRRACHDRRMSEESEGGFSEELAAGDSITSFGRDSLSAYDDSEDELPTGRHSAAQDSQHSGATSELSFKNMNRVLNQNKRVSSSVGSHNVSSEIPSQTAPSGSSSISRGYLPGTSNGPDYSSTNSLGKLKGQETGGQSAISPQTVVSKPQTGCSSGAARDLGLTGSISYSPHAPQVTSFHLDIQAALQSAEHEMEDLQRQVNRKNEQMQQAQKALMAYEEEISCLQKRLKDSEKSLSMDCSVSGVDPRQTTPQEEVRDELRRMKSQTAELSMSLHQLNVTPAGSLSDAIDDPLVEQLRKELDTLQKENQELTSKVKDLEHSEELNRAGERIAQLEQALDGAHTEKVTLEKGMEDLKVEKKRLEEELLWAQEEVMCVLSETHDADEEVQVYLQRLEESQRRREMLEGDLHQSENEVKALQQENQELQQMVQRLKSLEQENRELSEENRQLKSNFEMAANVEEETPAAAKQAVEKLTLELQQARTSLSSVMDKNSLMQDELNTLHQEAEVLRSQSMDPAVSPESARCSERKITQLQDALCLAIKVNKYLKDHMEQISERSSISLLMSDFPVSQVETEGETLHKVRELQEALDLALEAKDLLEKKAAQDDEVHPGLQQLDKEVQDLTVELGAERKRAQEEQELAQAMIVQLQKEKDERLFDLQRVREALDRALETKNKIEADLEAERSLNEDLRRELEDRGTGELCPRSYKGQDFPGLKAVRSGNVGATGELDLVRAELDSPEGLPVSAAKLRAPVQFGDEAQLRRVAIAAVTRLEEVEQELSSAVKEKHDLARQMVDISIASQELQKVVLETAQMTSDISVSKERRTNKGLKDGRGIPKDDPFFLSLKPGAGDFEVNSPGMSQDEQVSIPAAHLRNLQNELRKALQEKCNLENELADRNRRSSDFSNELKGLQDELKAALEMKEDLNSRFSEYEADKSRLNGEIARLSNKLDDEQRNMQSVEEAVGGLYALCKEVESAAGIEAAGRSMDNDFPASLPEAVAHLTGKVRDGICALVSHLQATADVGSGMDRSGDDVGPAQVSSGYASASLRASMPASSPLGPEVDSESARAEELHAQIAELQDARDELQEVLQEQSYHSNSCRPAPLSSSPSTSVARPSRFGYVPIRDPQRTQRTSANQEVLQQTAMDTDKLPGDSDTPYQQAVNCKEDELRQLQGAMSRMEQEMEALREQNEQLMLGAGQIPAGGKRGLESRNSMPPDLTQRVAGLQTRAQELEQDLVQVKIENAELKKAIDQVNGIARGRTISR